MEGTKEKALIVSSEFFISADNIYSYGTELFGEYQAIKYENLIYEEVRQLPSRYLIHPECRYMPTQNKMYRTIMLPAHFILYRIINKRIEVLDIISYKESISHIKNRRNIKP